MTSSAKGVLVTDKTQAKIISGYLWFIIAMLVLDPVSKYSYVVALGIIVGAGLWYHRNEDEQAADH